MFEYIGDRYHDVSLTRVSLVIDNAIDIVIEKKKILEPVLGCNAKTKVLGNEMLKP